MWLAFLIKEALWLQAIGLPAGSNMDFVFKGAWDSHTGANSRAELFVWLRAVWHSSTKLPNRLLCSHCPPSCYLVVRRIGCHFR
jgi:hypothetical protein